MEQLKIYEYNGTQIEFEVINGHVKANATLMAKAYGKDMSSIFRTIAWVEFEKAVSEDTGLNSVDLRSSKEGANGGTWIHEELVVEFARKLDSKFALWCNRKIAELSKTGTTNSLNLSPAELLLQTAQILVQHEKRFDSIELKQLNIDDRILQIESKVNTRPNYLTIVGYAVLKGLNLTMAKAKEYGKLAAAKCREKGYEIEKVVDTRFGLINSYPEIVLKEVFG